MEKALVIRKINQMPDNLMGIVGEFLDRLVQGYELGFKQGNELSETEKQEILDALAEYDAKPETGVKWENLKAELTTNHAL
ncbi:MAG: hypothetical protein K9J37_06715 [Saprospiraceae bacterium]|nr:hypothetical protein [Saprospiraceae bacterium]MCF8249586.1 hypothetical protein [Saprospiraceae bacterium]MCF8280486.1 hypothetical protein [Bacteroidales bacterium]MCF8310418.1 hypothetical protein [Saprospiraceae bacterium]MCF8439796.1 hypothetical protein [Saprospiraceae bacterium]